MQELDVVTPALVNQIPGLRLDQAILSPSMLSCAASPLCVATRSLLRTSALSVGAYGRAAEWAVAAAGAQAFGRGGDHAAGAREVCGANEGSEASVAQVGSGRGMHASNEFHLPTTW